MKQVPKVLIFLILSLFLVAGSAMAVPFGDGGTALQAVLDGITVNPPGNSSVDVTTDEVPDAEDSIWITNAGGTALFTMIIELTDLADTNKLGIYDAANPANRVEVFDGSATTANQAVISILADGTVRLNFVDTGVTFAGNAFGFYLDSSLAPDGGIWFSDTNLNSDGLDHMAAYQGVGDTIQIPTLAPGTWSAIEFILAFEDRTANSADKDYDDMVVIVEGIAPSPPGECSIGDFVWEDADRDGCQGAEEGIEGVVVKLFDGCFGNEIATTTTDATGFYKFDGLECEKDYGIQFVDDPTDIYEQTTADQMCVPGDTEASDKEDSDCGVDGKVCVPASTLPPGTFNDTIDCGYVCEGEIGDFVWLDENEDGCQDEVNTGIAGVDVTLSEDCDARENPKTVQTDNDGFYRFEGLCPGEYFVEFGNGRPNTTPGQSCDNDPDVSDEKDSNCGDEDLQCVELTRDNPEDPTIDCGKVGPCLELEKLVSGDGGVTFFDADECSDADVPFTADDAEYKLIVTNCGKEAVILDLIVDGDLGISLTLDPTVTIPPGDSVEFTNDAGQTQGLLQKVGACPNPDGEFDNTATVSGNGAGSGDFVEATDPACVKCVEECALQVDKKCLPPPPPGLPGKCKGKIKEFTMKWTGPDTIVLSNFDGIAVKSPGDNTVGPDEEVTFIRTLDQNDVFVDVSGLGQSSWHLSCSDDDMDADTNTNQEQDQVSIPPGQDCFKFQGNNKDKAGFVNLWTLEGLVDAEDKVLDCRKDVGDGGLDECTVTLTPPTTCPELKDKGIPLTSILFRYTAEECNPDANSQDAGKVDCDDIATLTALVDLEPTGKNGGQLLITPSDNIATGETFVATAPGGKNGKFPADSEFNTFNDGDGLAQYNQIHTSCSQPLGPGDQFGSWKVLALNGNGGGNEVTYSYTVTAVGASVENVQVVDDLLGTIPGPESGDTNEDDILDPGEEWLYTATAVITEETTNTVTVTGDVSNRPDVQCDEATDSVTVKVEEPTCEVSIEFDRIDRKKINLKMSNSGMADATFKTLDASWNVSGGWDGKLKKIKFDGATIYDGGDLSSPATIGETDWKPGEDRTLDAGNAGKKLELEFTKDVPKNIVFDLDIDFEQGCDASFSLLP
jgi:hypothetical protein